MAESLPQEGRGIVAETLKAGAIAPGTLWGIGVGPGNPDWLTLEGQRVLRSVAGVAVPQNRQGEPGMAWTIARSHLRPDQPVWPLHLPFVTDAATLTSAWDQAIATILPHLEAGQSIAFLAEGDTSFYSTFSHLARVLGDRAPQIPIRTLPGICSPLAAAAALGVPLSVWDETVVILPAMYDRAKVQQALNWAEVVVLMKVASVFDWLWEELARRQWLDRAALVEWVGGDRQQCFPSLAPLQHHRPPYFSLVMVWTGDRPRFPRLESPNQSRS